MERGGEDAEVTPLNACYEVPDRLGPRFQVVPAGLAVRDLWDIVRELTDVWKDEEFACQVAVLYAPVHPVVEFNVGQVKAAWSVEMKMNVVWKGLEEERRFKEKELKRKKQQPRKQVVRIKVPKAFAGARRKGQKKPISAMLA